MQDSIEIYVLIRAVHFTKCMLDLNETRKKKKPSPNGLTHVVPTILIFICYHLVLGIKYILGFCCCCCCFLLIFYALLFFFFRIFSETRLQMPFKSLILPLTPACPLLENPHSLRLKIYKPIHRIQFIL